MNCCRVHAISTVPAVQQGAACLPAVQHCWGVTWMCRRSVTWGVAGEGCRRDVAGMSQVCRRSVTWGVAGVSHECRRGVTGVRLLGLLCSLVGLYCLPRVMALSTVR